MKTYGKVILNREKNVWEIVQAQPHVCIKLKAVFAKISKTATPPFKIQNALDTSFDLLWFMERYPMEISPADKKELVAQKKRHLAREKKMEGIFFPDYTPATYTLNEGETARDYQIKAAELHRIQKRYLLGDDIGLGKTLSGILTFLSPGTLPGIVVVQVHLANQWKREIERFTSLKVHIIKGTSPYELPKADIYIFKYSNLAGWISLLHTGFFKSVVFDEA
jgi:SNF2 family DNA or RNA helicase